MSSAGPGRVSHCAASPGINTGAQKAEEGTERGQVPSCRMRKEQGSGSQELSRCRSLAQSVSFVVIADAAQRWSESVDEEENQDGNFAREDRQERRQRGMLGQIEAGHHRYDEELVAQRVEPFAPTHLLRSTPGQPAIQHVADCGEGQDCERSSGPSGQRHERHSERHTH